MVAAIDPWSDGKLCTPEDHWDNNSDGCPLAYISELLLNWPDSTNTPTVDLTPAEKIERLVSVILGYPKISRGMYPLDWPTHPESIKALKLSLLFDSITCARLPDFSSRTSISFIHRYYRKQIFSLGGGSIREIKKCLKVITSMIFDSLRKARNQPLLIQDRPTLGEMRVISALNSASGHDKEFWDYTKSRHNELKINGADVKSLYQIVEEIGEQETHRFKVAKIQSWIEHVTKMKFEIENYPISDGLRHNILVGSSTVIETIFAKLRHSIIKKYGASSIIIDGGGQIEFYSEEPNAVVNKWLYERFNKTFIMDDGYIHSYNNVIKQQVDYMIKHDIRLQLNVDNSATMATKIGEKQKIFQQLIGEDVCKLFLPPISYKCIKSESGDYFNDPETGRKVACKNSRDNKYKPLDFDENCIFCHPENYVEKSYNNFQDLPIDQVCFPHRLIYYIGISAKRRDTSWRYKGNVESTDWNAHKFIEVDSMAVFDLNSLSKMFHSTDNSLRGQIRRLRKSFRFNAIWWGIISKALNKDNLAFASLNAWIAAGDDITLVMRNGNSKQNNLMSVLIDIDLDLSNKFRNYHIKFSFGAGIAMKRETLFKCYILAREAEAEAKLHWKYRAKEYDSELIKEEDDNGNVKLKETRKIDGVKILNKNTIDTNLAHKSVVLSKAREEE